MNPFFQSFATIVVALAGSLQGATASSIVLYGGTASGGAHEFDLLELDPTTGSSISLGDGRFWTGLDFSTDGTTLYGVSSRLDIIDTSSGSETIVGPLSLLGGEPILMASMSISPSGEMFGLDNSSDNLYRIDITSGELRLVGTVDALVRAIEFGPDGTLYGAFATLFELNPADGSTIREIGRLGGSGTYVSELDYSQDGLLGVYVDREETISPLYRIDPDSTPGSLATQIAVFSGENIQSIASIPEPSVALLLLLALCGCFPARRRCH